MPKYIEQINTEHNRLVSKGREIVLNAPQLFISADIEADGRAGKGNLLSIGAITPDEKSEFYLELAPITDRHEPQQKKFCEENGLERKRLLREGELASAAIKSFKNWILEQATRTGKDPVLVGFAAGWDHGFLDYYMAREDESNPLGFASFDLKSLSMGFDGKWDWSATGKNSLPPQLMPEEAFTHNALDDAKWQQQLHFAMAAYVIEKLFRKN